MSTETLEQLIAIRDGAPENFTMVSFCGGFYGTITPRGWILMNRTTRVSKYIYLGSLMAMRSLKDIEDKIELMEDKLRLDHLQNCNEIFNKRVGSNYGWRVDWNHNRIAVVDTGLKGVSIRSAIDEHMKATGDL